MRCACKRKTSSLNLKGCPQIGTHLINCSWCFCREEGLVPYMPELPRPFEMQVNYNQSVFNVRAIQTAPAGLESTSVVLCYGLGKCSFSLQANSTLFKSC